MWISYLLLFKLPYNLVAQNKSNHLSFLAVSFVRNPEVPWLGSSGSSSFMGCSHMKGCWGWRIHLLGSSLLAKKIGPSSHEPLYRAVGVSAGCNHRLSHWGTIHSTKIEVAIPFMTQAWKSHTITLIILSLLKRASPVSTC